MPCCGATASMRTSSRGLRHFFHRNAKTVTCDYKSESPDHLALKTLVLMALRQAGWDATPEFSEGDWRADVLASKDGVRVAFEMQLSPQDGAETRRRHERYAASGVRCVWFMRRVPADLQPGNKMPAFELVKDAESGQWSAFVSDRFAAEQIDVPELVTALAERRVRYVPHKSEHLDLAVYNWATICWRCMKSTPVVMAYATGVCRCGREGRSYSQVDDVVGRVVAGSIRDGSLRLPLPVRVERRNSKMAGGPQWSSLCTACDVMQGNFFLGRELNENVELTPITGRVPVPVGFDDSGSEYTHHWCVLPTTEPKLQAPREPTADDAGSMTIQQAVSRFLGSGPWPGVARPS